MKKGLYLFVIFTIALEFIGAAPDKERRRLEYEDCKDKCLKKDLEAVYVCTEESDDGYFTRCEFNCHNKFYKGGNEKEVDCKPGSSEYCWNVECKPKEKVNKNNRKAFCSKHSTDGQFVTLCDLKCDSGKYEKDAEYVPC